MEIRVKRTIVDDNRMGEQLQRAREALGMNRQQAARLLSLSTVRLWMLEIGEADMESPEMWPAAIAIIRSQLPRKD